MRIDVDCGSRVIVITCINPYVIQELRVLYIDFQCFNFCSVNAKSIGNRLYSIYFIHNSYTNCSIAAVPAFYLYMVQLLVENIRDCEASPSIFIEYSSYIVLLIADEGVDICCQGRLYVEVLFCIVVR